MLGSINLMMGSEHRYLVGTRGNQPAWKLLRPYIRNRDDVEAVFMYGPGYAMEYLDSSDLDMNPDWRADLPGSILRYITQPPPFDTQALLEDTHYNQRYALGRLGAYVKLQGFGVLLGFTIKMKPGLRDPNYIDFLVKLDVDGHALRPSQPEVGQSLLVVDGLFASGEARAYGDTVAAYTYLTSVVALMYHDLVTAEDAPAAQFMGDRVARDVGWSYAPITPTSPGGHPQAIRVPLAEPRQGKPHHVRGHRRCTPITPAHREALRQFEADTGLRILEVLEERFPGQTFVRPHVVPAQSDVATLPRFIHHRLQGQLNQALAETREEE